MYTLFYMYQRLVYHTLVEISVLGDFNEAATLIILHACTDKRSIPTF